MQPQPTRRAYFGPRPAVTGSSLMQPNVEQTRNEWHFDRAGNLLDWRGCLDATESIPYGGVRGLDIGPLTVGLDHQWREPVIWPQVSAPPKFQAKLGHKPHFTSQKSADEYDTGYRNHQFRSRVRPPYPGTPMRRGWDDAEEDQHALNAERAKARA